MKQTRFNIGQLVRHKMHGYQAVIVDVDGLFQPSGRANPHTIRQKFSKSGPWYRLLVHESNLVTYVDENELELLPSKQAIAHPNIKDFLIKQSGSYIRKGLSH
ncbi:MAG: heat shock protein HspQ [Gammaproteobacteria bacterium]|nr:heat shock protein HspQ [Gammaproteobacteria bacterium]